MSHFETFSRSMVPLKREPHVTIQRRGTMSLNKSAHVALGSPDAVELLYDSTDRIVGLRPADPRADHAYPVRASTNAGSGPFVISAIAFTKFYDIDTSQSLRWPAYMDSDVLCINLDDTPTPVTSNRARTPQGIAHDTVQGRAQGTAQRPAQPPRDGDRRPVPGSGRGEHGT